MEFKGLDYVNGIAEKPDRGWWETPEIINGKKGIPPLGWGEKGRGRMIRAQKLGTC